MEGKEITKETQEKYLSNPNACPFCGSEDISGSPYFEAEYDIVRRSVQCENPNCGLSWTEHFKLSHIDCDEDES